MAASRSTLEIADRGDVRLASAPYEFGVKVSIVTTNARAPGGQFVLHAKALPGNPYDGHTLREVIGQTQLRDRARLCRQGVPRS